MDNLEIYNKYRKVPSGACKAFDNGRFKGTDINTMWRIKCLTEQFGVVGFGWVTRVIRTWTEAGDNGEVLAFAEIGMRVKMNGEWSEEWTATGGNTMIKYNKSRGGCVNSDEAFKMAITDAFGVACKYLGIGADVYWENDKTKYTESVVDEPDTAKDEPKITEAQKEQFKELGVNEMNTCKYYKVDDISELTEKQAQYVINSKKRAMGL